MKPPTFQGPLLISITLLASGLLTTPSWAMSNLVKPGLLSGTGRSTTPATCAEPNPDASTLFTMLAQSGTTSDQVKSFLQSHLVAQDAVNDQCKTIYDVSIDQNRTDLFDVFFKQFGPNLSAPELAGADSIYSYVLVNSTPAFFGFLKTEAASASQQLSLTPVIGTRYAAGVTALMIAAGLNPSSDMVPYLLSQGSAPNDLNGTGETALMFAVGNPNGAVPQQLIQAGASVNTQDSMGDTALMFATSGSADASVVHLLLAAGALVNTADSQANTALIYAVGSKDSNPAVAQALVDAGSTVDVTNSSGVTVLMFAASNMSSVPLIQALIRHGARVNATTSTGDTALMSGAAFNPSVEVLQALIEAGAEVNAVETATSGTALEYAVHTNLNGAEIARALIAAGAKVNVADKNGVTPLMNAAFPYPDPNAPTPSSDDIFATQPPGIYQEPLQDNIISLLIQSGASLTAQDNSGQTAFAIARSLNAPAPILHLLGG